MKLEVITPRTLGNLPNQELLSLHRRLHQLAGANFYYARKPLSQIRAGSLTWGLLTEKHRLLREEMEKRKLKHSLKDVLDLATWPGEEVKPTLPERLDALYLVAPHGRWLAAGKKKALLKSKAFNLGDRFWLIVESGFIWGVAKFNERREIDLSEFFALQDQHLVTNSERKRWWGTRERFYFWPVKEAYALREPQPIRVPRGVQVFLNDVEVPKGPWFRPKLEVGKARKPLGVLGIIIRPDGKFLLMLRRNPPRVWSPPGGFLSGRQPERAILEEIQEEVAVEVSPLGYLGRLPTERGPLLVFAFRYEGGKPRLSSEAKEVSWFSLDELKGLRLSPPARFFQAALAMAAEPELPFGNLKRNVKRLPNKILEAVHRWLSAMGQRGKELRSSVEEELVVRGISIEKALRFRLEAEELYKKLPDEVVIIPEWGSATGGFLYAGEGREPNDVDFVFRSELPAGSALKFSRLIEEASGLPAHLAVEKAGPTWDYAPIYDLVARKRPEFEIRRIPGDAQQIYKALIEEASQIQIGKPLKHYGVAGEYYAGEEEEAWEKWARRIVEKEGIAIAVQEKFDGFRFHVQKAGDRFWVFSDKGLDRASVFPNLLKLLQKLPAKEFILDTEFVQLDAAGKPVERWEMAWMGGAKEPREVPIRIYVHDLVWLDGKNLANLPYLERLQQLGKILPRAVKLGHFELVPAQTKLVRNRQAFLRAIAWAKSQAGSEGAMLKRADFRYQLKTLTDIVKLKSVIEIDAAIIGYRKIPAGKPEGVHWSREEALRRLPKQLEASSTYIFRVALRDEKTEQLIPLEAQTKLTEKQLHLDWDEERQRYTGTDDPELWTMFFAFEDRGPGEFAYANTYALKLDTPPRAGDVVVVTPAKLRPFIDKEGNWHLAWMFPRAKQVKRQAKAGSLQAALKAFGDPEPERLNA